MYAGRAGMISSYNKNKKIFLDTKHLVQSAHATISVNLLDTWSVAVNLAAILTLETKLNYYRLEADRLGCG